MNSFFRFLFPMHPSGTRASLFLLACRIFFGLLLVSHGIQKLQAYAELSNTFPDPLGVGSKFSLTLAIMAELVCSLGFIFGALYRLCLIPMAFTMTVACFVIHATDPFSEKELPFVYLSVFILLFIAGPGKFAIDRFIAVYFDKKQMR
ncbi:MAG: DoxX family protein [Tannerellaceae bacterium]|nr:DoxX family protein [Tannerellaceae bacterium]